MTYDLAIIGAGPAGANAAEYAAENGLSVLLFEEDKVGGTCLNRGCVPSKTLLYSSKMLEEIKNSKEIAINTSDTTLDMPALIKRKDKFLKEFAEGIEEGFRERKIKLVKQKAVINGKDNDGNYLLKTDTYTYKSKKLLIATGSETVIPPIKGIENAEYWTSREALNNKEIPKSLTVIGGGVIGMEFVSFFVGLGVKITVVEMAPKILGETDEEFSEILKELLEEKGVVFHLSTEITEIKGKTVFAKNKKGKFQIKNDKILLSVGRKPVLKGFGLETLRLKKLQGNIKVNKHMQTSDTNVYICGDLTGKSPLVHTAVREGQVAINHMLGRKDKMDYNVMSSVVYSIPEIASVGKTEKQLKEKGVKYKVAKVPLAFASRYMIENIDSTGFCKIISDEKNRILGGHIIGNKVSEIITYLSIAIQQKMTTHELATIAFPHPTIGEIIHYTIHPAKIEK